MKRRGIIAALVVIMVMVSTAFCFAGTDAFKMVSSYPKDGQKNTSIENVSVKVRFNHSVSGKAAQANNKNCVKIVDQNGKAVPTKVLVSDSEPNQILVLADNTDGKLKFDNNADYKLIVGADLIDDKGEALGTEQTVTFRTFNQKVNNIINMVMMFVMFGGIMFATVKSQKDQQKEQEEAKTKNEPKKEAAFNPYREAKRTGKSVEEVIAEEKKRQEKEAKKAARKKKKEPEYDYKLGNLSEILPYVYHVSKPAPIKKKEAPAPAKKGAANKGAAHKHNVKRGTGAKVK